MVPHRTCQDLIKRTAATHPDHRKLVEALEAMEKLADRVNTSLREVESRKKLTALKRHVVGLKVRAR